MDDLISRQAALDALEWTWAGKAAFDAIKNLPSAQPERKKGKWGSEWFDHKLKIVCSACGCFADKMTYYCPNCGAEMETTDDKK